MIIIVNYGMGNAGSILNMLKKIGVAAAISSDPQEIAQADKLILPGVGSFDAGVTSLHKLGIWEALNKRVLSDKTPILGICLGMQLFTRKSEEGSLAGLGWIEGQTIKFKFGQDAVRLKIPHMGWNTTEIARENTLLKDMEDRTRFYFVHSFHVVCEQEQDIIALTQYGYKFVSAVNRENIFGVQFHPEKSHKYGMALLKRFAGLQA